MRLFKKLDIYILKAFLQLFAGTFFICLFVFLMQFTWRYVNELVGKGLSTEVLVKFFYYASMTLVPMALPLSILLAALITFGNFGERLELLAMKAAGVPLLRILQPIFLFILVLCGCSFIFQNEIGPRYTQELARLVWSMKQKSPELEIPEGTFYDQIPGYNLYVEHKDMESGMLYGVMIYSVKSYDDVQITLADSGRIQSTADKSHLKISLFSGERFQNLENQNSGAMNAEVPYMRETFSNEVDYIAFADSFNLMDANLFSSNAATKDLASINRGIDSLGTMLDSLGRTIYQDERRSSLSRDLTPGRKDSASIVKHVAQANTPFDTLVAHLDETQRKEVWRAASIRAQQLQNTYEFRQLSTTEYNNVFRQHWVEFFKKFSLSVACLVFFLVGAPLGAIIRKGGLGMPVVISVLIFIFYYILNVSGEKMAKQGAWPIFIGVWMSTMILLPIGLWLTAKANKDSVVFNVEGYRMFFRRLLGLRTSRHLNRKEVIIYDPDYTTLRTRLATLVADCDQYVEQSHIVRIPNYKTIYFEYRKDVAVVELNERLEAIVEELHNSKDNQILALINDYPILFTDAHTRPFRNARRNKMAGIFFPLGIFFYFRIWRYRLRLWHDMQQIKKTSQRIIDRINDKYVAPPIAVDISDEGTQHAYEDEMLIPSAEADDEMTIVDTADDNLRFAPHPAATENIEKD